MNHQWTDAEANVVRRMWAGGATYAEIAAALSGPDWLANRAMVAGKVNRLKLPRRNPNWVTKKAKPPPETKKVAKPMQPKRFVLPNPNKPAIRLDPRPVIEPPVPPLARMLSVIELKPKDCRWVIGDPRLPSSGFCGAPKERLKPYCAYHARIAYVTKEKRRKLG